MSVSRNLETEKYSGIYLYGQIVVFVPVFVFVSNELVMRLQCNLKTQII